MVNGKRINEMASETLNTTITINIKGYLKIIHPIVTVSINGKMVLNIKAKLIKVK
jgi:hypothetical protein